MGGQPTRDPNGRGERPQPTWASCHSPNTNTCQDLGNTILVLLGLVVSINLGVNTATLVRAGPATGAAQLPSLGRLSTPHLSPIHRSPQVLFTRKRHTSQPSRKQSAKDVHLDAPWTLCPRDLHPAICSHNWDCPKGWEASKLAQEMWAPWAQDSLESAAQTICSQETIEGRPLKTQIHSELGLEAYVYPGPDLPGVSGTPRAPSNSISVLGVLAHLRPSASFLCDPPGLPVQGK
ncbi:spermatid maturation protein 1-like [Choloepus didactylus]|uniref:spermatid maturation protein 1-like n=1 Tax=Choloepus didactylus TaxID=27675 RepID=UPI0018A1005C|nr:spermatid maturation protein 1-like [Choloepus didactylus]